MERERGRENGDEERGRRGMEREGGREKGDGEREREGLSLAAPGMPQSAARALLLLQHEC